MKMEGFGSRYDNMLDSLKMEQLNERTSSLDGIYAMSNVNIVSILIFVLSLKMLTNLSAKIQTDLRKNVVKQSTDRLKPRHKNLMES